MRFSLYNAAMGKVKHAEYAAFHEEVFEGLGFIRYDMENVLGKYPCYKGSDGFFYLITGFGDDEYVIEYTETEEAARKGLFWDADWFYGKPEKVIPEIRAALLEYIKD